MLHDAKLVLELEDRFTWHSLYGSLGGNVVEAQEEEARKEPSS